MKMLTAKMKGKGPLKTVGKDYLCRERFYGTFSRSFSLPKGIDAKNVKATFKEGILEIVLYK